MKKYLPAVAFVLLFAACNSHSEKPAEKPKPNDSLSKAGQNRAADSVRATNPLLIVPPDSTYTGEYKDKYDNGIVKYQGQFRFGKRHGHWRAFFKTGTQWSEMHYDKGIRSGPSIVYRENGTVSFEGFYKEDQMDSVWTFYDEKGAIQQRAVYQNGKLLKNL